MARKTRKTIGNQRRKPKQERARRKYDAVLDACTQLLLAKGYRGTSMLELSLTSDVAIPTIYQYFPNKEGVFRAWFARLAEQVFDELRRVEQTGQRGNMIELYIATALQMLSVQKGSAEVLLNELPGALTAELIGEIERQTLDFVDGLFGGVLNNIHDKQKQLVLIRLLLGYTLQIVLRPQRTLDIAFESRELAVLVAWYFSPDV